MTSLAGCAPVVLERVSLPTRTVRAEAPPFPAPAPAVAAAVAPTEAQRLALERDRIMSPLIALPMGELSADTLSTLDQLARFLEAHPEIVRLEIQGHLPRSGRPRQSKSLSQRGAEVVRRALIERGVSPSRLIAKGYGEDRPIADNVTREGREKNRRVELRVLSKSARRRSR